MASHIVIHILTFSTGDWGTELSNKLSAIKDGDDSIDLPPLLRCSSPAPLCSRSGDTRPAFSEQDKQGPHGIQAPIEPYQGHTIKAPTNVSELQSFLGMCNYTARP
ncbi:hypothetical protein ROHU_017898 [Labeo rohita]|uniref:Uncharacterized protein n=1 Tax=Labeo rohita TaxID=84645 RepID=A0A498ND03_LABRO|nr:hypothetical protein ROHU_017898 [Labeo rohita]